MTAPPTPQMTTTPKTLLPGFGRLVNYVPQEGDFDYVGRPFASALSYKNMTDGSAALPMLTLREITMLQFMNNITDKPDWHIKVHDEEIVKKWTDEAMASGQDVTEKMIKWCIDELRHNAKLIPPLPANPPPIIVYNGDVVKSDYSVSPELKARLQKAVIAFEMKIPERLKDWHPNSDGKVLDLVHPSLFPLLYGRTRILANGDTTTLDDCIARCGQGEVAPVPSPNDTAEKLDHPTYSWQTNPLEDPFSAKFQWLPSEVDISGDEARITTYINNLHPEEKVLYDLVSKLIDASIPLWDLTLAPLRLQKSNCWGQRISYPDAVYDPDPENGPSSEGPQQEPGETDHAYWNRREQWYMDTRKVVLPEPEDAFKPLASPPEYSLKENFKTRGLQVIVKLANIELTPEKPDYQGGSWHVEGQMNEHIVATSLYYYSCSNITTSTLSFRQQCDIEDANDIGYPQHHHEWLEEVFGCKQDGPAVQEIGGVETREGRLLTFPNILQHRVGPFKLQDPTKPGHRKIVALFLVDPYIKIISTAHVPCQQQDWWWDATRSLQGSELQSLPTSSISPARPSFTGLPAELQDHILKDVDFPISLEEAKELRLELMEERKDFVVKHGEAFETINTFSLCEH